MKKSVLLNVLLAFLGLGLLMGMVFPLYAHFFVDWKPGMLAWFIAGALVSGLMVGLANYFLLKWILLTKLLKISDLSQAIAQQDLTHRYTIDSDVWSGTSSTVLIKCPMY